MRTELTEPTLLEAMTETLGSMARESARFLSELVRSIVSNIKLIPPLLLSLGCQAGAVDAAVAPPLPVVEVAKVTTEPSLPDEPKALGKFNITFYYMIGEEEVAARSKARAAKRAAKIGAPRPANDNRDPLLAAVVAPALVTIYEGGTCDPITKVSKEFAAQLALQGTGKLKDGRVINVWGHCSCGHSPCFKETEARWGTSGNGRRLQPFRTVAVDPKVVKLGSLLYVPALEGRTMPGRSPWGGFVHDGCVIADDTGGKINDNQLDLFVGRKGYYHGLSDKAGRHTWTKGIEVFDGTKLCERKGRRVARRIGSI